MVSRADQKCITKPSKNLQTMNICFFTENFYKGGLDTFFINLFNAWPDREDELTLVCNNTHPGIETIENRTVRPIKLKTYNRVFSCNVALGNSLGKFFRHRIFKYLGTVFFLLLQYPVFFPWYVITLTFLFRKSHYDSLIVVNGGYPASLLCRSAAIAWRLSRKQSLAIFNFHNSAVKPSWYFWLPEYLIDLAVIWSCSKFVSVSKNCLGSLNNRKAFRGCNKLYYIYNGIEDPILKIGHIHYNKKIQRIGQKYCLMLATYEPRKGHSFLLQAFQFVVKDFPEVVLKIYGYGKPVEKQIVADEAKRLSLENNVIVNDFTSDTTSLIANASVLVVPSQAYESFGLTIIEAMAFGIPVVTTDVGGMPEILSGSNAGFVCSKNDPFVFGQAINTILRDTSLANTLGRNGRKVFEERFTAERMALSYKNQLN